MSTLLALLVSLPALASPPLCSAWPGPAQPGLVPQDTTCTRAPPIGTFNPVVEWNWAGTTISGHNYSRVMMTPVVGNLTDDNGDGKIDEHDIPDIVFTAYDPAQWPVDRGYREGGAIIALSGDGSGVLWKHEYTGGYRPFGAGGVVIGDIDSDRSPEVCYAASDSGVAVVCLNANGNFQFAAFGDRYQYGAPNMADMNHDGRVELVFGPQIFDDHGQLLGKGVFGDGRNFMSTTVDWDGDGIMDVVAGNVVYNMQGDPIDWLGTVPYPTSRYADDSIPAIADLDGDGYPDVVKVTWGEVVAIDNLGRELWRVPVPGGGNGGAPTVADMDGDGTPDVGVAGKGAYAVFDGLTGQTIWERPVTDNSSSVTGSSVFDFEGDGRSEVVYADETTLWVFSGATGAVLMQDTHHGSATLYEYPVIADVDGDGHTEIVVASNGYGGRPSTGITVIGDLNNSWQPSRPIWNQYQYHITNVNNDGTIPRTEIDNWRSWNNFRAGGVELGPSSWLTQLFPGDPQECLSACAVKTVSVWAPVLNSGLLDALNIDVGFYRRVGGVDTLITTLFVPVVPAGDGLLVGPVTLNQTQWGPGELVIKVDSANTSVECVESDNVLNVGTWPYPSTDMDGDGHEPPECGGDDCNDHDATIYPGAYDIPGDGIDQDCVGGDTRDCDVDDDGYLSMDVGCGGDDCNDYDASIHPGAYDLPGDGVDQDCADGDARDCDLDDDGYLADDAECGGDDCDDNDATIHPGAVDIPGDGVDQDCADGDARDCDLDDDGYLADDLECGGDDCNDLDASIHPGAEDVPGDGIDQDCAGGDAVDCDVDGDRHRSLECGGDDCDDGDASIHPRAEDLLNDGVDSDCDGLDGFDPGTGELVQRCGCQSSPTSGSAGVGLLALLLVRRRRR